MRRRPNNRPTVIYWLVDARTGVPFYCGKTVLEPAQRLYAHRQEARTGARPVHAKVRECGEHVRMDRVDTVPVGGNWVDREKFWIRVLRAVNTNCCNVADGGAGTPGRIVSTESREKMSAWQRGRKLTPEHRAKIREFMTGRTWPAERVERMRAKMKGRRLSPEHCAKISENNRGRPNKLKGVPRSTEIKAKISAANKGRIITAEHRAKISAASKLQCIAKGGRVMSAEAMAKAAATRTGQKRTPEQRARMSAAHKGKNWSQARRDAYLAKYQ